MADCTGPIATMPGSTYDVPHGAKCDEHDCVNPATVRIQGETDSMGAEMHDFCGDCAKRYRVETRNADTSGTCEWCKKDAPKLFNQRDDEEGTSGRVYQVCEQCRSGYQRELRESEAHWESQYGDEPIDDEEVDCG